MDWATFWAIYSQTHVVTLVVVGIFVVIVAAAAVSWHFFQPSPFDCCYIMYMFYSYVDAHLLFLHICTFVTLLTFILCPSGDLRTSIYICSWMFITFIGMYINPSFYIAFPQFSLRYYSTTMSRTQINW
jgi:hypothetical protein